MAPLSAVALVAALAWGAKPAPAPPHPKESPLGQPLVFKIAAEPAVAKPGQQVVIRIGWLCGLPTGSPPIVVNRRGLLGRETVIELRRGGKTLIPLKTPPDLGEPEDRDFKALAPGEGLEYDYPLLPKSEGPLPPGRYEVRVVYQNDAPGPGPFPAWTGKLTAKTKFRVREAKK